MSDSKVSESRAFELFEASLDQPPEHQLEWLKKQCANDQPLLERIIELRNADANSGDFLESSILVRTAADRIGQQIGPWEITEEIAQGGMSIVYKGRRNDGAYQQDVAVKLFHTDFMSARALARFDVERQILASLEHPGIARIIDGGTTSDGVPYAVMELVSGLPITEYCNSNNLDLDARLRLFQSVCRALEVAHTRKVVHRDIKPGNVLTDDNGQVRGD